MFNTFSKKKKILVISISVAVLIISIILIIVLYQYNTDNRIGAARINFTDLPSRICGNDNLVLKSTTKSKDKQYLTVNANQTFNVIVVNSSTESVDGKFAILVQDPAGSISPVSYNGQWQNASYTKSGEYIFVAMRGTSCRTNFVHLTVRSSVSSTSNSVTSNLSSSQGNSSITSSKLSSSQTSSRLSSSQTTSSKISSSSSSTPNTTWWKPTTNSPIHWHWQLSQDFVYPRDVVAGATVYDIDGELTSAATVAQLHAMDPNIKVICYFDAGVYEDYRSDASSFPSSVIGNTDSGWNGSNWLDIRQQDILLPIMEKRMQNWCKNKGFDAIEPDETEVWSNNSGFSITKAQNNDYNMKIAAMAHSLGLSVALKGNTTEAVDLWQYFDFSINEQCWQYSECSPNMNYFLNANKAVFNIEYKGTPNCTQANSMHMNSAKRDLNLVGPTNSSYVYTPCVSNSVNNW